MARSCLEDVFKLDLAENCTEEVSLTLMDVVTLSGFGLSFKVSASLFSTSSRTGLIGFVFVATPL